MTDSGQIQLSILSNGLRSVFEVYYHSTNVSSQVLSAIILQIVIFQLVILLLSTTSRCVSQITAIPKKYFLSFNTTLLLHSNTINDNMFRLAMLASMTGLGLFRNQLRQQSLQKNSDDYREITMETVQISALHDGTILNKLFDNFLIQSGRKVIKNRNIHGIKSKTETAVVGLS